MEFFQHVIEFFNDIIDWFNQGLYDFVTQVYAQYIIYSSIATLKFKLWMIGFAWDVAQQILSQLNITAQLNSAFASLDSDLLSALNFFNIPHALSILLSAATTKFVLKFMGQ